MCGKEINFAHLSQQLGLDFATTYATELASLADLENDQLLVRQPQGLAVTPLGRLFLRIIAMRFDAHLTKRPGGFSKTI